MNSGANDETAAAEDLDLTMLLLYPALFSVMLHRIMNFVPSKTLYTNSIILTIGVAGLHYSVVGLITLQCGRITLTVLWD